MELNIKSNKKFHYKRIFFIVVLVFLFIQNIEHTASQKLVLAISKQNREEINRLVENTWNLNSTNGFKIFQFIAEFPVNTPMSEACRLYDSETIELLISKGASVNHVLFDLSSPLVQIANHYGLPRNLKEKKGYNLMKMLLDNGADPNQKTKFGYPIFSFCNYFPESEPEISEYLEGFKLLIDYGANINVKYEGKNIILYAALISNYPILEYLLNNYDLDINYQHSINKKTALMYSTKNVEMIKLLLSKGADKTIKDFEGNTAYDIAVKKGHLESAELLK